MNPFDQRVAGIDIDARVQIGQGRAVGQCQFSVAGQSGLLDKVLTGK
ncbi:hypothetical protein [Candidatus Glomeribacter gigasporarum]|nr:hypothetical protein [Candidatus Glomeribacter gigasporarum]